MSQYIESPKRVNTLAGLPAPCQQRPVTRAKEAADKAIEELLSDVDRLEETLSLFVSPATPSPLEKSAGECHSVPIVADLESITMRIQAISVRLRDLNSRIG